jgi:hypothetical protein
MTVADITNKELTEGTKFNDHHLELQSEAPVSALLVRDDDPVTSHKAKLSVSQTHLAKGDLPATALHYAHPLSLW